MKIAIVYTSATGTTAAAAEAMSEIYKQYGHDCTVFSVSRAVPEEISAADLVCFGSWVKGLFIIRQHPAEGTMRFISRSDKLEGKNAVVFCTYKIAAGSTLKKMSAALEEKGAKTVGSFKFRGREPNEEFKNFASTLS